MERPKELDWKSLGSCCPIGHKNLQTWYSPIALLDDHFVLNDLIKSTTGRMSKDSCTSTRSNTSPRNISYRWPTIPISCCSPKEFWKCIQRDLTLKRINIDILRDFPKVNVSYLTFSLSTIVLHTRNRPTIRKGFVEVVTMSRTLVRFTQ